MPFSIHHRFYTLVDALEQMPACSSREEAYASLIGKCFELENQLQERPQALQRLLEQKLDAEHGWHELDADPCYWQDAEPPTLRIYIHHSGQFVFQSFEDALNSIVFSKPSALGGLPLRRPTEIELHNS